MSSQSDTVRTINKSCLKSRQQNKTVKFVISQRLLLRIDFIHSCCVVVAAATALWLNYSKNQYMICEPCQNTRKIKCTCINVSSRNCNWNGIVSSQSLVTSKYIYRRCHRLDYCCFGLRRCTIGTALTQHATSFLVFVAQTLNTAPYYYCNDNAPLIVCITTQKSMHFFLLHNVF